MLIRTRSIIILFSQGLTQATLLILGIVLVRLLSKELFGTFQQAYLVYISLAAAISLQLHTSLYYFVPKLKPERHRTLLAQTILVTVAIAMIVGVIVFFGAEAIARMFHNPDLVPLLRVLALYPFAERLVVLVPAFMISVDRPVRAGVFTLIASLVRIGAVVAVCSLGYGLVAMMWTMVAAGAIAAAVGCLDMVRLCPVGEWRIDRSLLREQFSYSWPLLATALVGTINLQLNKILISMYFEPGVYAVYSCGVFQLPVIALVTMSVNTAMMPNLVAMAQEGRMADALWTWQEGARKCSLIIFPCFAFFLVVGHDLMILMFGEDYGLASLPFRVYLFSLPIRVAIYATLFRATGKTRPVAIAALISLSVNIVVSTTLILSGKGGTLSYIGPTIGTVVATWSTWSFLLWQITRITAVPFGRIMRWKELGSILLACVGSGIVVVMLPLSSLSIVARLTSQAIVFVGVLALIIYRWRLLKSDEKQMLRWPITAIRNTMKSGER